MANLELQCKGQWPWQDKCKGAAVQELGAVICRVIEVC